jgi:hypothetical protein
MVKRRWERGSRRVSNPPDAYEIQKFCDPVVLTASPVCDHPACRNRGEPAGERDAAEDRQRRFFVRRQLADFELFPRRHQTDNKKVDQTQADRREFYVDERIANVIRGFGGQQAGAGLYCARRLTAGDQE